VFIIVVAIPSCEYLTCSLQSTSITEEIYNTESNRGVASEEAMVINQQIIQPFLWHLQYWSIQPAGFWFGAFNMI